MQSRVDSYWVWTGQGKIAQLKLHCDMWHHFCTPHHTLYVAAGTNIVAIVLRNIGPSGAVQTVDYYVWYFGSSGGV